MEEIWKDIPDYEGIYRISNYGRIAYVKNTFRILSLVNQRKDYFRLVLRKAGIRQTFLIHRLVYELFEGAIPKGYYVHHKDGNKQNNHIDNLELISPKDHAREHYVQILQSKGADISKNTNTRKYLIENGKVLGINKDYKKYLRYRKPYLRSSSSERKYPTNRLNKEVYAKHRPINQLSLSGEFIKRYETATDAGIETGVCARNILQVADKTPFNDKGNYRKQAGGYRWEFAS